MWKFSVFFFAFGLGLTAAEPIRTVVLDPERVVDLPVSHEITTVLFPGVITGVAGSDMAIDGGKDAAEAEVGSVFRFQVSHAPGANFVLIRSLQPEAAGRLTVIFEGSAYVVQLHAVDTDSLASLIFKRPGSQTAVSVDAPPGPVRFTPRIGFSLLDRARAYPVLAKALPRAVEGVTLRAQNRKLSLPDLEITVQEVYRFSKEDAVVFLLQLHNPTDCIVDLAPSTFAVRIAQERFEQAIANGPRSLNPGESAEAEFAIVGAPDGTRNDLSADNAFTILVNCARRAQAPTANTEATHP